MPDPGVIKAIEAAVAADPDNTALRCHLVELLTAAGEHERAWDHAVSAVVRAPDDAGALRCAIAAGRLLGRDVSAYDRMLKALEGAGDDADTPPAPAPVFAGQVPDTVEELLAELGEAGEEPEIGFINRPVLTLGDVGGMAHVKQQIERSFLAPLRNPELQAAFGKRAGGGLVLWGPPGCGKTFIARALAGQMEATFYEVGLSDVLDMWLGSSERNLSKIFEYARRNAPCVVFFDEIDALGQRRAQMRGTAMRTVVNQLLAEMDGASSSNDGLYFLAATNHPWDIDPALLRPGRFDRKLLVLPPDEPARDAIFAYHLRGRPTLGVRTDKLAAASNGLTGADIRLVCDDAIESALARSIDTGVVQPIEQSDLVDAVKRTPSSIGQWVEIARNYAMFSNESGSYDELMEFLKRRPR